MANPLLQAALQYMEMGLSVIPIVPGDKKALIAWTPFQTRRATKLEITSWWSRTPDANIGIVTGPISDLAVVDIDTEEGKEAILEYIPDSLVTPTTKTPKGGNHLYFSYPPNFEIGNNARLIPGCDFRGKNGYVLAPPSKNGNGIGYEWIIEFDRAAIVPLPEAYLIKIKSTLYKGEFTNKLNHVNDVKNSYFFSEEGRRDQDLFHVATLLKHGHANEEEMKQILNILAQYCNPPFPEKEVDVKIKSVIDRAQRKIRNISQEVRDWSLLNEGNFLLKDCYSELKLVNSEEQAIARVTISGMIKEGLLEKYGIMRGQYKTAAPDCPDIDLWSPTACPLSVKYPLGIHEFIVTHPKNIIVVAGEPNAGKTALVLNFAQMNCGRDHEVVYFSSEMGAIELQARLKKFNLPMDEWRKIVWKERASDFASVIRPNAINIIDFLEVHDEFYKIGLFIKQIFDKLENGIAFIALQKNKGRDEGIGGTRSLEKARLYLAMEPGILKIVKAKNWRDDEINPNGSMRKFKLGGGCHFKAEGDWYKG